MKVSTPTSSISESRRRLWTRPTLNGWSWLILPAVVVLGLFFLVPLFDILAKSVTDPQVGFDNFVDAYESKVFRDVMFNTIRLSLIITALCILLGYPYALLMTLSGPKARALLMMAVLIPFWSAILVRTYAWTVILQKTGIVNSILTDLGIIDDPLKLIRNEVGVVVGMTHVLLPFMVLPIYAVIQKINLDLVRAAESLGARPVRAFTEIFLPLSAPGVVAGSLLVFVVSIGYYITPSLLGGPRQTMAGEMIVTQIRDVRAWGFGSALGISLLLVVLLVLAVVGRVVNVKEILGGGPAQ